MRVVVAGATGLIGSKTDTLDAVRRYLRVDAESGVVAAVDQLARTGAVDLDTVVQARDRYGWQG